jgi:hypothetical protein
MNFRRLKELIPNIKGHVVQMGLFSNLSNKLLYDNLYWNYSHTKVTVYINLPPNPTYLTFIC